MAQPEPTICPNCGHRETLAGMIEDIEKRYHAEESSPTQTHKDTA